MSTKYKNNYFADGIYGYTVDILADLNPQGVHLDIGCGYAAIHTGIIEKGLNLSYIGIDADAETVEALQSAGIESYQRVLGQFGLSSVDADYIESILNGRNLSSISMLDVIEHLPSQEALLETVHTIALKYHAPVIISVPNITHKDVAFKLIEGRFDYTKKGLLDNTHLSFFTEDRLTNLMKQTGFEQISSKDLFMEKSDQHFPEKSIFLSEGSLVFQYLNWLKTLVDPNATVNQFLRVYLPREKTPGRPSSNEPKPFLSVITRTQGKRAQALTEALLCLTGQTNTDFEVLVLGHKLNHEQQHTVERIIEDMPEWIRCKTRLIRVDYGNRTTPLNVGFSEAKGSYIAILDDDDIIFDNWVEEFYRMAKENSGSVLHTYAISQNWMTVNTSSGVEALRACGSPQATFCRDFDFLGELMVNSCPPVSLAFPAYAFQKLNIRFDEDLTTTEDWDFLMRTGFVCGVSNSDTPTCVYRLWTNSESSQTVHSKEEWKRNHLLIQRKFDRIPIVLPPGIASSIISKGREQKENYSGNTLTLFFDNGFGFSEKNTIAAKKSNKEPGFFEFPGIANHGLITRLRFDPTEMGMITLHDLVIKIETPRDVKTYGMKDIRSNGIRIGQNLVFIKPDPQIILRFPWKTSVAAVMIQYQINNSVPNELMDSLIIHKRKLFSNILYRSMKKIYHIIKYRKSER
ncbi:MAG: Glycosyl transferase family 2 [Pelotomaculum sp. PtaB.Bin104]|nr:MAG: Glycosyl transferase family 2 [Pelotomaculum sp. PtaB.Bin104]